MLTFVEMFSSESQKWRQMTKFTWTGITEMETDD